VIHVLDPVEAGQLRGVSRFAAAIVKLSAATGADGAQVAVAVLLYPVNSTLADAVGIIVARGPSIVSRASLAYEGTVNDAAKITAKIAQLAAVGIIARDGV
jgi:hypothetical protein